METEAPKCPLCNEALIPGHRQTEFVSKDFIEYIFYTSNKTKDLSELKDTDIEICNGCIAIFKTDEYLP